MPSKNSQTKSNRTHSTHPNQHIVVKKEDIEENKIKALDFLRFGESYTSLILGIVVVVIATILLLSFVRTRNLIQKTTVPTQKAAMKKEVKNIPNIEQKKTTIATRQIAENKKTMSNQQLTSETTYTVKAGDSLWTIAEQIYKSGYNWADIAQANKLTANPGVLYSGMKLTLPKVTPKLATVTLTPQQSTSITDQTNNPAQTAMNSDKITGTVYTIQKGDNLWSIAVRAYGDGYRWTQIAQANHLTNPSIINVGNNLSIPR